METDERTSSIEPAGVMATAFTHRRPELTNMGSPSGDRRRDQLATRERQAGPHGVEGIRGQNLKPLCSGVDYRNELTAIRIGSCLPNPAHLSTHDRRLPENRTPDNLFGSSPTFETGVDLQTPASGQWCLGVCFAPNHSHQAWENRWNNDAYGLPIT